MTTCRHCRALLEAAALAALRAYLRQPGGPSAESMLRHMHEAADLYCTVLGAGERVGRDIATALRDGVMDLEMELEAREVPEVIPGTLAQLDALALRRVGVAV